MSSLRKSQIHASFAYIHRHISICQGGEGRSHTGWKEIAFRRYEIKFSLICFMWYTWKANNKVWRPHTVTAKLNLADRYAFARKFVSVSHVCVCLCSTICNCIENHKTLTVARNVCVEARVFSILKTVANIYIYTYFFFQNKTIKIQINIKRKEHAFIFIYHIKIFFKL